MSEPESVEKILGLDITLLAKRLVRLAELEEKLKILHSHDQHDPSAVVDIRIAGASAAEARAYALIVHAAHALQEEPDAIEKLSVTEVLRDLQAAQTKILARATLRRLRETAPEAGGS